MANLRTFDLNLLKVFDALMAEGTTVAAGRRIGLSQPAVSAALKRLREALGDELFVRSGQRLAPTAFAKELGPQIRALLATADQIVSGSEAFDPSRLSRVFRMSCGDYFTTLVLGRIVRRLQAEAPDVRIENYDEVFGDSLDRLRDDSFDLALLPEFDRPPDIDYERLFVSDFLIVARPEHPRLVRAGISPGEPLPIDLFCDLPQARFGNSPSSGDQNLEDKRLAQLGRRRKTVVTSPNFSDIARLVQETDLIGVLPGLMARQIAEDGSLWCFPDGGLTGDLAVGIYWHRRHREAAHHRWIRALISEEIRYVHRSAATRTPTAIA